MAETADNVKAPEKPLIPDKPVEAPDISVEVPLIDLPAEAVAIPEAPPGGGELPDKPVTPCAQAN